MALAYKTRIQTRHWSLSQELSWLGSTDDSSCLPLSLVLEYLFQKDPHNTPNSTTGSGPSCYTLTPRLLKRPSHSLQTNTFAHSPSRGLKHSIFFQANILSNHLKGSVCTVPNHLTYHHGWTLIMHDPKYHLHILDDIKYSLVFKLTAFFFPAFIFLVTRPRNPTGLDLPT